MFKTHFRTGCSKCPQPWNSRFQTDDVLGDSQPLALVYFHQIVIFQWTQWFASSDWSNSSPPSPPEASLCTSDFSKLCGVNDSLVLLARSSNILQMKTQVCRLLSLTQIFHLYLGPTGTVWLFLGGFHFLWGWFSAYFYFGPTWTQNFSTHLVFSLLFPPTTSTIAA